ncbi:MAG: glycosyltransferase [Muribaculum sp.]|nr:glycosyltransferase [Muribaculum sp.]
MKIIHICGINHQSNGVLTVLLNLSRHQSAEGHNVTILNFNSYKIESPLARNSTVSEFKNIIKNGGVSIVIIHGVFFRAIIGVAHILLKNKIPYLIELHGALSMRNYKKSWFKKFVARKLFLDKILKGATGIIYLNYEEYNNSAILNLNSRSLIIPNGCDLKNINLKHISNEKVEFLFLGRIDISHKGLDYLLDALEYLSQNHDCSHFHFSFYGNGEMKDIEYLKKRIDVIGSLVDYYGPVYGNDKQDVFLKSDVFLLTSRYEGFPMTILEALSLDVPCFVSPMTNVTSLIDIYDCGWVAMLDYRDIAEKIIESSLSYKEKRLNCQKAIKNYSWPEIARKSIMEYSKILYSIK